MSLAVASLVLLAIAALVAVPVSTRVLGAATRRNDDRPGGDEGLSDQKRPSDEEIEEEAAALKRTAPSSARGLGRAAAIFSVVATIFAMSVGQGYVPGRQPADRGLPAKEPGKEAGAVN